MLKETFLKSSSKFHAWSVIPCELMLPICFDSLKFVHVQAQVLVPLQVFVAFQPSKAFGASLENLSMHFCHVAIRLGIVVEDNLTEDQLIHVQIDEK